MSVFKRGKKAEEKKEEKPKVRRVKKTETRMVKVEITMLREIKKQNLSKMLKAGFVKTDRLPEMGLDVVVERVLEKMVPVEELAEMKKRGIRYREVK